MLENGTNECVLGPFRRWLVEISLDAAGSAPDFIDLDMDVRDLHEEVRILVDLQQALKWKDCPSNPSPELRCFKKNQQKPAAP